MQESAYLLILPQKLEMYALKSVQMAWSYLKSFWKICKTVQIPSHTPFDALLRFNIISNPLYTQFLTWNGATRLPTPTPLKQLKASMLFSGVLVVTNLFLFFIVTKEVLSYERDPELTSSAIIITVLCSGITLTLSMTPIYLWNGSDICFVYRSVETLKQKLNQDNGNM